MVVIAVLLRWLRDTTRASLERALTGEVTDPLTGLANRRGLERDGSRRWSDRARERVTVALLVVDIDHFKRVNDQLGHAVGDELLRRIAVLLRQLLRKSR